jgi:adenylosuccinate lyase
MKELTRSNKRVDKNSLHEFIDKLDINDNIKNELKQISPYNYTGI